MSKSEFILLIPGIIYGVALVDLLKIYRHPSRYWETSLWGIIMFLTLIVSWFLLFNELQLVSSNILYFALYLLTPLIFAQTVFTLTPEEGTKNTKEYFLKSQRTFFSLLLANLISVASLNLIMYEDPIRMYIRIAGLPVFIGILVYKKLWMRVLLMAMYIAGNTIIILFYGL